MAAMDTAIFETVRIKLYGKTKLQRSSRIILLQIFIDVKFLWHSIISHKINVFYENDSLYKMNYIF